MAKKRSSAPLAETHMLTEWCGQRLRMISTQTSFDHRSVDDSFSSALQMELRHPTATALRTHFGT
jgi:hypothetical protein